MTTQDPIFIYASTVTCLVPTPLDMEANILLNLAHGYEDGLCNFVDNEDGGKVKGKKEDPELLEAAHNLHRGIPTLVYVSVFRDGTGNVGFEEPSKKEYKEVYRGFYVPKKTFKMFQEVMTTQTREEDLWGIIAQSESRVRYAESTAKSYGGFSKRITPRKGLT